MNQSEALTLAVEMLERVAPGKNYDTREFYDKLRDIKSMISAGPGHEMIDVAVGGSDGPQKSTLTPWPRTAIVAGEEFCEIDRRTIEGRDLILMESCRDGGEAPAIIIDANTNEMVLGETYSGFRDHRLHKTLASRAGKQ